MEEDRAGLVLTKLLTKLIEAAGFGNASGLF
jgi:hypothetical protein